MKFLMECEIPDTLDYDPGYEMDQRDPMDVLASALDRVRRRVAEDLVSEGKVFDDNGNSLGRWTTDLDPSHVPTVLTDEEAGLLLHVWVTVSSRMTATDQDTTPLDDVMTKVLSWGRADDQQ